MPSPPGLNSPVLPAIGPRSPTTPTSPTSPKRSDDVMMNLSPIGVDECVPRQRDKVRKLKYGTFECRPSGGARNFVFVPAGYKADKVRKTQVGAPTSGGSNNVHSILSALGVPPPQLAFMYEKGHGIAPPECGDVKMASGPYVRPHDAPEVKLVEQRVLSVMQGISDACEQTGSIHVLCEPFAGNRLSELVCESARGRPNCVVLGLFLAECLATMPRSREPASSSSDKEELVEQLERGVEQRAKVLMSEHPELSEEQARSNARFDIKTLWDPNRAKFQADVWDSATAASPSEVDKLIPIHTDLTPFEQAALEVYGISWIPPGALPQVSHAVVFERDKDLHAFRSEFEATFKTGLVVAGGTRPVFERTVLAMQSAMPLFVFRGTGQVADLIGELADLGKELEGLTDNTRRGEVAAKLVERIRRERDECQSNHLDRTGFIHKVLDHALVVSQNFPETFSSASVHVIDVGAEKWTQINVEKEQDEITRVMTSVYSRVLELGGAAAELRSLEHANKLRTKLEAAARQYQLEASALYALYTLVLVSTTVATASTAIAVCDAESEAPPGSYLAAMVLPLTLSVVTAFETTYRPVAKHAAFWAAAKRLEAEVYFFRTRTGAYNPSTGPVYKRRRELGKATTRILTDLAQSDARGAGMPLVDADTWLESSAIDRAQPRVWWKRASGWLTKASTMPRIVPEQRGGEHAQASGGKGTRAHEASDCSEGAGAEAKNDNAENRVTDRHVTMDAHTYLEKRALHELKQIQHRLPQQRMLLRTLQLLVICGSAVVVALQSASRYQLVHVMLSIVSAIELTIYYLQLQTELPASDATVSAITRALVWWDGLSLIQQRMPGNVGELVNVVEGALLMQHEGYVRATLAGLGRDLGKPDEEISDVAKLKASMDASGQQIAEQL